MLLNEDGSKLLQYLYMNIPIMYVPAMYVPATNLGQKGLIYLCLNVVTNQV